MASKDETKETPAPVEKTTEGDNPVNPAQSTPLVENRSEAAGVTAETLVEPLAGAMPEPTAGATDAPDPGTSTPVDANGTEFDPDRHKAQADGTPAVDKKGRFYSKNLGTYTRQGAAAKKVSPPPAPPRPKPTFAGAPAGSTPPPLGEAVPFNPNDTPITDQYFLLADVYLQTGYGPLMLMLGADVRPTTEEHLALRESLAAWLRSIRATEFSPGLAFTMTAAGIFISKFEKPTVRERAALTWLKVKQLWARFTGKKPEQREAA